MVPGTCRRNEFVKSRKRRVCGCLGALLLTASAAQAEPVIVELKDGTVYRGEVVEKAPKGDLVIQLVTGDVRRMPMANVVSITPASAAPVAANMCSLLDEMRELTQAYLTGIGASCIDLFDACPAEGFADVLHTNARGDEVIARALAAYVGKALP